MEQESGRYSPRVHISNPRDESPCPNCGMPRGGLFYTCGTRVGDPEWSPACNRINELQEEIACMKSERIPDRR